MQSFRFTTSQIGLGLAFAAGLAGCAGHHQKPPSQEKRTIEQMLESETGDMGQSLADRIMAEAPARTKSRMKVEGEIRRGIWWWLRYYSVRDRERFSDSVNRGSEWCKCLSH